MQWIFSCDYPLSLFCIAYVLMEFCLQMGMRKTHPKWRIKFSVEKITTVAEVRQVTSPERLFYILWEMAAARFIDQGISIFTPHPFLQFLKPVRDNDDFAGACDVEL